MQFSHILEIMAGWLDVEVGIMTIFDGSLHIYDNPKINEEIEQIKRANTIEVGSPINDSYQSDFDVYDYYLVQDARLPKEDFEEVLTALSAFEETIRRFSTEMVADTVNSTNEFLKVYGSHFGDYWMDYGRVLYIYTLLKHDKIFEAMNQVRLLTGACQWSCCDYIYRFKLKKLSELDRSNVLHNMKFMLDEKNPALYDAIVIGNKNG